MGRWAATQRRGMGAIALAALVLAAGCTGGTSSPEPSTPAPTAPATSATPSPTPEPPPVEDDRQLLDLALERGSSITVAGTDANGEIDPANVARVSYRSSSCEDRFDDIATDPDGRVQDIKARKNEQLCLFEFAVTNLGPRPISWTAEETASLIGSNQEEYLISNTRWSAGAAAEKAGKRYSGDGDLIARGKTEYDYVVFELPDDVEPVKLRFLV